ncbi:hypothetical protein [Thiohalocapsa sp. ML1]|uniref:hypothetical protein n=1 Tax=Thiohalocapsa sp. ML1 TaxID=1431688 RepID=UPI0007324466|nr:hypothetical protein [Thiohalocapsa sp. ML1]
MDLCAQRAAARALVGRGLGLPLSALARINPKAPRAAEPARCRVLRIKDLDHQLGVAGPLPGRNETAWRSQTRVVTVDDVLLSTFAAEPKVAYIDAPAAVAAAAQAQAPGDGCVLPSELVLTLCFHRWPGAYALVLESPPVLAQWRRLATGGGLRFVQPAEAAALALPLPEPEQATAWQERLTDLLAERRAARGTLQALADQLHWLYRASHPERSAQPESPTA